MKLKENNIITSADVFTLKDGEPLKINIKEILKGKKSVLFGVPGAYTSVCSAKHLPGYVKKYEAYKAKGIEQKTRRRLHEQGYLQVSCKGTLQEGQGLQF